MNWSFPFGRWRREAERELDEELRFHVEMETEANVARGYSQESARRKALRDLGGVERTKDDTRDTWAGQWAHDALRDLRLAMRWLRREPGFAVVAIGTLALAIGANAAVFSAVDRALLTRLPYAAPDRLVTVWLRPDVARPDRMRLPGPDVAAMRQVSRTLQDIAFVGIPVDAVLNSADGSDFARVGVVSANFFGTLGVEAASGRTFGSGDVPEPPPGSVADPITPVPVVLSHGYWQRRFGGRDVIGSDIRLNAQPSRVIGVLPPSFVLRVPPDAGFAPDVDVWSPVRVPLNQLRRTGRRQDQDTDNTGVVIGRLARGTSREAAQEELSGLFGRIGEGQPDRRAAGVEVVGLHQDVVRASRPSIVLLQVTVGIVLLIACLNLVNLLVARAVHREKEFAVRAVLGATGDRLVRQSVAEGALLAVVGGGMGLLVGIGLTAGWSRWGGATDAGASLTWPGVGFTLAVTGLVAVVVGVVPAWVAVRSATLEPARRGLGVRSGLGGSVREGVVILEMGLTVALMTAAGLMLRSFAELQRIDPGFEPTNRVAFDITLSGGAIGGPGARSAFIATFRDRLTRIPGVRSVGLTGGLPLSGRVWTQPFGFEGDPPEMWDRNEANFRVVTSDFLPTMGVRLLAGRYFTPEEDIREDDRVVVIDATLAARFPGDLPPIGRRLGIPLDGAEVWAEVVGVVEPVRYESLRTPGRQTIYVPYRQEATRAVSLVVRTESDPAQLGVSIHRVLEALGREADFPVHGFRRLEDDVAAEQAPVRLALQALGAFAVLTVLLAAVGLYGVIAYHVGRRRWEIGLRLAVGATPASIVRSTVGHTLRLAGVGVVLGAVAAAIGATLMQAMLVNVSPLEPQVFGAAAVFFGLVSLLAGSVPAWRASRVNPTDALRAE